jgi:3-deoxy-D-manno-octulosonic-acid transferase
VKKNAWTVIPLRLRLAAFRLLESAAAFRHGHGHRNGQGNGPSIAQATPSLPAQTLPSQPCTLWVFVSTIGELNAIEPFLNRLWVETGQPPLVLITDRPHYGPAYLAKYPQATVEVLSGSMAQAEALARKRPPLLLLVAEIPCVLHDAPCRFSFATVRAVKRAGGLVVLVNGWLYGYAPPSRMDRVESAWFGSDYLQAFDLLMVQTPAVRETLLQAQAAPDKVVVTGNIKFDAMLPSSATLGASPLVLAMRARGTRFGPVIVAGSVTEAADQRLVLQAFVHVRRSHPSALLILAPRHPENLQRMALLRSLLEELRMDYRMRSEHGPDDALATSVLVLDTMGELRSCYAESALAFVGTDHNVLEPMAFGKPVFVGPGWEPTYPSYPVYLQLLQAGALHAVADLNDLGPAWADYLALAKTGQDADNQRHQRVLAQAKGAVERSLQALRLSSAGHLLKAQAVPLRQP